MRSLVAVALLGLLTSLVAQTNYDTVQVHAVRLSPGLHLLFGAGGNIGVSSGSDGTFIIDDPGRRSKPCLRCASARNTRRSGPAVTSA